jgi:hypothetical protein
MGMRQVLSYPEKKKDIAVSFPLFLGVNFTALQLPLNYFPYHLNADGTLLIQADLTPLLFRGPITFK